ncbi:SRPBCC family protein [Paracoccus aminophilus]|uniref:Polyketide cyclase/dehydrase n=1 Tax=Paracoccus aminophilus JCM 7686 TaxID=1367847 RepID=S5YVK0_PARAH|nr:SRPBCC family protein [Paracoccus aminophilus]AGT09256.1 hypothetical protein JCM7686_2177 [Paracoccus aminophilus JCM 7686]
MKFSTRQDTDLASEQLFDFLADFDRLERLMTRRGVVVRRIDPRSEPGVGRGWELSFDWRGKRRNMRLDVVRFDRPELIAIEGQSELFEISIDMAIVALTPTKSRLNMQIDVRPRSMRARLLLQTAKLGKGQLDRKFDLRIAELLGDVTRAAA